MRFRNVLVHGPRFYARSSHSKNRRVMTSSASGGTIHGMTRKTTIYLSEDLKSKVESEARRLGQSEAEVIRQAISRAVDRPRPRGGLYRGEPITERADELLRGFGER